MDESIGWLAWIALPMVALMYVVRRRLASREVAGLFLWRAAVAASHPVGRREGVRPLACDLVAASMLAMLATGWEFGPRALDSAVRVLAAGGVTVEAIEVLRRALDSAVRVLAVLVCVVALAVHWAARRATREF